MTHDIRSFLACYSRENRANFNEELFIRSEYDIIKAVQNIILSVTNSNDNVDSKFVIKVNYFNVIEDYRKVKEKFSLSIIDIML